MYQRQQVDTGQPSAILKFDLELPRLEVEDCVSESRIAISMPHSIALLARNRNADADSACDAVRGLIRFCASVCVNTAAQQMSSKAVAKKQDAVVVKKQDPLPSKLHALYRDILKLYDDKLYKKVRAAPHAVRQWSYSSLFSPPYAARPCSLVVAS